MLTADDIFQLILAEQIKQGVIPHYLYKYRSIDTLCLRGLASHSLFFSCLESFNDPFEGKIFFSNQLKEQTLGMIGVDTTKENIDDLSYESEKGITELQNRQSVCCFSKSNREILLWSHYANWHTGLCLKFDLTKDLGFFSPILSVSYDSKMTPSDKMSDFLHHLFQRKYKAWRYEKEYRVVKNLLPGPLQYNSKALVEVIFGCRTEPADMVLVQSILGKNVRYKQCHIDNKAFKLTIGECDF